MNGPGTVPITIIMINENAMKELEKQEGLLHELRSEQHWGNRSVGVPLGEPNNYFKRFCMSYPQRSAAYCQQGEYEEESVWSDSSGVSYMSIILMIFDFPPFNPFDRKKQLQRRKSHDVYQWAENYTNISFYDRIEEFVVEEEHNNVACFLRRFTQSPHAYHVTHMSNAVKILQSGRMKSRNKAQGEFTNSAGSVVERRHEAHDFVRFYFRPKSSSQFYFECLGLSKENRYYQTYEHLGKPKCPLPVFFIFDIKECLEKFPELCWYSTGNMQADATQMFKVMDNPDYIDGKSLYSDDYATNKCARQQEFLVKDEVDLTQLSSLRIACYDEVQCEWVKRLVQNTPFMSRIDVNPYVFIRRNQRLFYEETDDTIKFWTNFAETYFFRVEYGDEYPHFIDKRIVRNGEKSIILAGSFTLRRDTPFVIYFEDFSFTRTSWLIYTNE